MKAKTVYTHRQKIFGALLNDSVAFMRHFWADEITLPPSTRQKFFWNDVSKRLLLATGRKTAKTLYLEARIMRKSMLYRNKRRISERAFGAPGDQQLQPTILRLMTKIKINPLFTLMLTGYNKNDKVIKFATNVMWHLRIDGTAGDDRNWVGLRLDEFLFDEAAFTTQACHKSRQQSALPGCYMAYAGVPNSVRHTVFWELDQTKAGKHYSRHKFSSYVNPLFWSIAKRDQLRQDFGERSAEYTTQVMGRWGAELYSSFPPEAIAIDERIKYRLVSLNPNDIPSTLTDYDPVLLTRLYAKLAIPKLDTAQFNDAQYILGMDYGFRQDPTEIVLGAREHRDSRDWKVIMRIHLANADPLAQARLLEFIADSLGTDRLLRVGIDLSSGGVGIALELTQHSKRPGWWEQVIVDLAAAKMTEIPDPTKPGEYIKMRNKQFQTQTLQMAFMAAKANLESEYRIWIGRDEEMVQELIDTREQKRESGNVVYLPRMLGGRRAVDHILDSLRAMVMAMVQAMRGSAAEDDGSIFLDEMDWCANPFDSEPNPNNPRIPQFREQGRLG